MKRYGRGQTGSCVKGRAKPHLYQIAAWFESLLGLFPSCVQLSCKCAMALFV